MEYVRHGTAPLLTAPEVHRGKIRGHCASRHTTQGIVLFLGQAVAAHRRQQIHVILDNLVMHKTPRVRTWLDRQAQAHYPSTRTYACWLNQVETWLGLIMRDCLRRGIFRSVSDLTHKIITYIRLYNWNVRPFRRTYPNPRQRIHASPTSITKLY